MITGQIRNREAVIELDVSGSDHLPPQHIEAVLDTGYNGHLTLGKHLVAALQLRFAGHGPVMFFVSASKVRYVLVSSGMRPS